MAEAVSMVADIWVAVPTLSRGQVSMAEAHSMAERSVMEGLEAGAQGSLADLVAGHGSMAVRHTDTRSAFAHTVTTSRVKDKINPAVPFTRCRVHFHFNRLAPPTPIFGA
jgi:hypothetical protein